MKANRIINIWLWVLLCVPCLLASCDHDVHNGTEDGGLSVSLSWADQADLSTPVKDVKLWIFNADGMLVTEKHYGCAEEMASERFQLPEGCYRILAATNLTSPFTIADATGAISSWDNIQIALSSYDNVAANAYYGVANVTIDNKEGTYVVQDPLKSVLAELTIIIEGVPQGTEMNGKVLDGSQCLFPTQKDADGNYGLPSTQLREVTLQSVQAQTSTLQSGIIRLMPTVASNAASHIYLNLQLPNGVVQEFDITAPTMKTGGKYQLQLQYNQMQPKMNLDATINNWTDLTNEVEIK